MRAIQATRSVLARPPVPLHLPALALLLGAALLSGCASGEKSVQDLASLAGELSTCLPAPPQGWVAEATGVDQRVTDLDEGKLEAMREYAEIDGKGEMEINVRTSPWCCWLVNFGGDLVPLTIQGRKAGMDPKKNKAVLYVTLTYDTVVIFEADNMPNAEEAVKYFASKTDFDCLKEKVKAAKKRGS